MEKKPTAGRDTFITSIWRKRFLEKMNSELIKSILTVVFMGFAVYRFFDYR
ncbi:MAG: hypothetical protein OEV64_11490 [Desulfobulbaceae bacterium]|nr:hypothetical protein [Desulfobulbaceae bacterium]